MAGRHRRPPAWRRLLMRLRRHDRAARTAALQAQVVALRATVTALQAQLAAAQAAEAIAVAHAAEATAAALAAQATVVAVSTDTLEIDLRDIIEQADLVLAALPEAALLDPKRARGDDVIDLAGSGSPVEAGRHIA